MEWTRAQVAIMRPDPHARAIASVIRDLMQTREGTTFFVGKISGMLMRYNLPGDHPLIGCSAPDFEFEDGTRLGDLCRKARECCSILPQKNCTPSGKDGKTDCGMSPPRRKIAREWPQC